MKRKLLPWASAWVVGTAALLTLGAGDESDPQYSATKIRNLERLVTSLEKRVGAMEKRLQSLESRTNTIVGPFIQPWPERPPAAPGLRGLGPRAVPETIPPKIWGRGECNGWPYYLIPVHNAPGAAK